MRQYSVVGNLWAFESNPTRLLDLPSEWPLTMPLLDSRKRDPHSEPLKSQSGLPHATALLRGQRTKAEKSTYTNPEPVPSSLSHCRPY